MIKKIYLHWTAGRYDQLFNDYHICVDGGGGVHFMGDFNEKKAHTWQRNTDAIGIALCCAYGASIYEGEVCWGAYPPTDAQINALAKVVALLCRVFNLDMEKDVLTHAEVATIDGYGIGSGDPETKWDLLYLPKRKGKGGEYIRQLATGKLAEL